VPSATRPCTQQFSGTKFALPHLGQEYRCRGRRVYRSESTSYQFTLKVERLNKGAAQPKYKEYEAKEYCTEEHGPQ